VPDTTSGLTVPEIAKRYRVSEEKVRNWINKGELKATNTAMVLCGRPRWVISTEALAEFERRRAGGPPPRPPKKGKRSYAVDYFPHLPG
jgi:excisionase family DNA binding protein